MSKKNKRKKNNMSKRDKQRLDALAAELRRVGPVVVPDGIQCPDCSAKSLNNKTRHDESCPAMNALSDVTNADRVWFEEHPEKDVYIRPVTRAEIIHLGVTEPVTHTVVTRVAPGLRRRKLVNMNVQDVDPQDRQILNLETGETFRPEP